MQRVHRLRILEKLFKNAHTVTQCIKKNSQIIKVISIRIYLVTTMEFESDPALISKGQHLQIVSPNTHVVRPGLDVYGRGMPRVGQKKAKLGTVWMNSMKHIFSLYADDLTHLKAKWLKLNVIYWLESLLSPSLSSFWTWCSVTNPDISDQILQKKK